VNIYAIEQTALTSVIGLFKMRIDREQTKEVARISKEILIRREKARHLPETLRKVSKARVSFAKLRMEDCLYRHG
jgi:uncharacterized protein HemY